MPRNSLSVNRRPPVKAPKTVPAAKIKTIRRFSYFSTMPTDLILLLLTYGDGKDLANFSTAARFFYEFIKQYSKKFLYLVMNGNPNQALSFFNRIGKPDVVLESCIGREDHNQRLWNNKISSIQFLTLAGNFYLLNKLIRLMPVELYPRVLEQIEHIEAISEPAQAFKHFLTTLKKANENIPLSRTETAEVDNLLQIGAAQKELPRFLFFWICYKTNISKFIDTPVPSIPPAREALQLANGTSLEKVIHRLGKDMVLQHTKIGIRAYNPSNKNAIGASPTLFGWSLPGNHASLSLSEECRYYTTIDATLRLEFQKIKDFLKHNIPYERTPGLSLI